MKNLFVIVMLMRVLPGCSWLGFDRDRGYQAIQPGPDIDQLVATDLVLALTQLEELQDPSLVIEAPLLIRDEFALAAIERLKASGYYITQVPAPDPDRALKFASEERATLYSTTHRFFLAVGEVVVERDYSERNGALYPRSAMKVAGSRTEIVLDDQIFQRQDWRQSFPSGSESNLQVRPVVLGRIADPELAVVTRMTLDDPTLFNVYELQKSNYQEFLATREMIFQQVVIFPNDSSRLTREGRRQVRDLVDRYDASSDWIHVMGCSHGHSDLPNGNEELAKQRVLRIAQELYTIGVAAENVLAESCWSPVRFDEGGHPRRGVTLFIQRSNQPLAVSNG